MTLPGRFAEYGLSGAFFWICQVILLLLLDRTEFIINLLSTVPLSRVGAAPQLVQTLVASLLAVLAIITIFTTGLLLDICATYFVFWEMGVFKRHLDRNASWLIGLIEKYKEYSADDYQQLHDRFGNFFSKEEWLVSFDLFVFWKRERRRHYFSMLRRLYDRYRLIRAYDRLWSFLISYVIIQSGSSQLSVLTDLISQWRVGRAISIALVANLAEGYIFTLINIELQSSLIIPALTVCWVALSLAIILSLYSRVCHTLFSLAYVTKQKESPPSTNDLRGV